MDTRISHLREIPKPDAFDRTRNLVVLAAKKSDRRAWQLLPGGEQLRQARSRTSRGKVDPATPYSGALPNKAVTRFAFAAVDADISAFERLTLARKLVAAAADARMSEMTLVVYGFEDAAGVEMAEALVSAALARSATMPNFKSETEPKPAPRKPIRPRKQGKPKGLIVVPKNPSQNFQDYMD